jgi:hypothetical protein
MGKQKYKEKTKMLSVRVPEGQFEKVKKMVYKYLKPFVKKAA